MSPASIFASITKDETTMSNITNCFRPSFILGSSIGTIVNIIYKLLENVRKIPNNILFFFKNKIDKKIKKEKKK